MTTRLSIIWTLMTPMTRTTGATTTLRRATTTVACVTFYIDSQQIDILHDGTEDYQQYSEEEDRSDEDADEDEMRNRQADDDGMKLLPDNRLLAPDSSVFCSQTSPASRTM